MIAIISQSNYYMRFLIIDIFHWNVFLKKNDNNFKMLFLLNTKGRFILTINKKSKSNILFSVADNGIGIPRAEQKRIFEKKTFSIKK